MYCFIDYYISVFCRSEISVLFSLELQVSVDSIVDQDTSKSLLNETEFKSDGVNIQN
jgi:hypothetical protein